MRRQSGYQRNLAAWIRSAAASAAPAFLAIAVGSTLAPPAVADTYTWTGWPVAISPADPQFVVAAHGNDLLVSRDGGVTWKALNGLYQPNCPNLDQLVIAGASRSRIFAHTCAGILYSDDLGESWGALRIPVRFVPYLVFANPANADELVLRSGPYLYQTADFGATWKTARELTNFPGTTVDWHGRAVFRWSGSTLERRALDSTAWASVAAGLPAGAVISRIAGGGAALFVVTNKGVFRSVDQGATWVDTLLPSSIWGVDVGGSDARTVYAYGGGAYRSDDGGTTWTAVTLAAGALQSTLRNSPDNGTGSRLLFPFPDDGRKVLVLWSYDGLLLSTDAATSFVVGLPPSSLTTIVVNGQRRGNVIYGRFKSTDSGASWRPTLYPGAFNDPGILIWANGPQLLTESFYAALPGLTAAALMRSVDDGVTWARVLDGANWDIGRTAATILRSPDGLGLVAFGMSYSYTYPTSSAYGVVFRSPDDGASWGGAGRLPNAVAFSAVVQPKGTDQFIAGLGISIIKGSTPQGLARTSDPGTWPPLATVGLPTQFITALASSSDSPSSALYAALDADTLPTVYKSTDLGTSWTPAASGLPAVRVIALAADPATPGTVYAGTNGAGIYRSRDAGGTWSRLATGAHELHVRTLKFDGVDAGRLYAATDGGLISLDVAAIPDAPPLAVEYFYPAFGHYFLTAFPEEAAALDRGAIPGWVRTGETFAVDPVAALGVNPVCRFFTTAFAPKSSHFYTPYTDECAAVKKNAVWQYEAIAFGLRLRGLDGTCPAGYRPLYRLYNNGQSGAPNHRYTVKVALAEQMKAQGWIAEGDAATGAFACVPN